MVRCRPRLSRSSSYNCCSDQFVRSVRLRLVSLPVIAPWVLRLALPPDGGLIACDLDADYLKESRAWWIEAGIDSRIESRLGPGIDTLTAMLEAGEAGSYDFMYVDADKESAVDYFELGLQLLRPGGLYTVDNMFRGGRVADPAHQDESTVATRALVDKMATDDRIDWSLVPIGDGLGIGLKR